MVAQVIRRAQIRRLQHAFWWHRFIKEIPSTHSCLTVPSRTDPILSSLVLVPTVGYPTESVIGLFRMRPWSGGNISIVLQCPNKESRGKLPVHD
jgi:hypothetical protein